ncbi:hypothetical protein F4679DRAFT_577735 [Xylaria curta]|nr:hypothetical protein F4679DRAFT_577735 [Xylaria curta]
MGGVLKRRARRSRLPKVPQEKLLDAVASQAATDRKQSPARDDPVTNAQPVRSTKRRRNTTESDPLPAKRTRLTRKAAQQRQVIEEREEREEKAAEPIPQQSKRPYSSPQSKSEHPTTPSPNPNLSRQIDTNSHNIEHNLTRARLTRQNLAMLDEKKGKGKKTVTSSASDSMTELTTTTKTTSIKTTSTTSAGFLLRAAKNGILLPAKSKRPENFDEIQKILDQSRESPSPESEYKHYCNRVEHAINETTMVYETARRLIQDYIPEDGNDEGYERMLNQAFTGFPKNVGFNNGLSPPQPDLVEGFRVNEFFPFPVDEEVNGGILVKDDLYSVALPHWAGEWKGRGKNMEDARFQSAYDGAALVYSRNSALEYLGTPDPLGHAKIITFTTDGNHINFFAHYSAPSEDGILQYHQYLIATRDLKFSHQGHNQGRRELRNIQDYARRESRALKDQLKKHWILSGHHRPIAESPMPSVEPQDKDYRGDYKIENVQQLCQTNHPVTESTLNKASRSDIPSSVSSVNNSNNAQKRKGSLSEGSSHKSSKQRKESKSNI